MLRKWYVFFVVVPFLYLSCSPSFANDMPRYQPQTYCKKIAAFGGSYSESTMESCMDMEQAAYDSLKVKWLKIPIKVKKYCDRIARFGGGGSYSTLQSCISMELKSKAKNSTRKFKF